MQVATEGKVRNNGELTLEKIPPPKAEMRATAEIDVSFIPKTCPYLMLFMSFSCSYMTYF